MKPRFKILLSLTALVTGALMTTLLLRSYEKPSKGLNARKLASLKPSTEILPRTKKLKPPFSVKIINSNKKVILGIGEELELEAKITVTRRVSSLNFQWLLPPGVSALPQQAIQGRTEATPREGATLRLVLVNNSEMNQRIHLKIWADEMTVTAQYNTQWQEYFDQKRKSLSQKQNEYIDNIQKQKLFH